MLDAGINYAATATSQNALIYALGGIFGGFRGNFAIMPYFYKVREYNDYEARDLWSYQLNLTSKEIDLLIDHLWELSYAGFDYYFFDENCSYYMLAAIEAAAPRYNLTSNIKTPWVIPADTLRAVVVEPGLVGDVTYRPSERALFNARLDSLSKDEKKTLKSLIGDGDADLSTLAPAKAALVLDTAIGEFDFRNRDLLAESDKESDRKKQAQIQRRKLLLKRSKIKVASPEVEVLPPVEERPDDGHGSARIGSGFGHNDSGFQFIDLKARFSFHDLLDPSIGYPQRTQIEMGNLETRISKTDQATSGSSANLFFQLQKFSLVELMSINPVTEFEKKFTWRVQIGLKRALDKNCDNCLTGTAEAGFGYTANFKGWDFALLLDSGINYGPEFIESDLRLEVGPRALIYYGGLSKIKFLTQAYWHHLLFSEFESTYLIESELRWSPSNKYSIGAKVARLEEAFEASLSLYTYF